MKEIYSNITPEELLSAPTSEGERVGIIYSELEVDRLSALQNAIENARYIERVLEGKIKPVTDKIPLDQTLLRAVRGAGFGAYCELKSSGMQMEANEILIAEGIIEEL